jgi:hypothetical protein
MKRNDVPLGLLRIVEKVGDDAAHLHLGSHEVVDPNAQITSFNRIADEHLIRTRDALKLEILLDEQSNVMPQLASSPGATPSPEEIALSQSGFLVALTQVRNSRAIAISSKPLSGLAIIWRTIRRREAEVVIGQRVEHADAESEATRHRHDDCAQIVRESEVEIRSVDRDVDGSLHVNGLQRATFLWSNFRMNAPWCKFWSFPTLVGKHRLTISIFPVSFFLVAALLRRGVGSRAALSKGVLYRESAHVAFNGRGEMKGALA